MTANSMLTALNAHTDFLVSKLVTNTASNLPLPQDIDGARP